MKHHIPKKKSLLSRYMADKPLSHRTEVTKKFGKVTSNLKDLQDSRNQDRQYTLIADRQLIIAI